MQTPTYSYQFKENSNRAAEENDTQFYQFKNVEF